MSTDADRLASIEARLAAATPGPWETEVGEFRVYVNANDGDRAVALVTGDAHRDDTLADADLIAHAPDDLRWLLGRLREAEAERDRAEDQANNAATDCIQAEQMVIGLQAALVRVRAVIDSRRDIDAVVRRSSIGATGPTFVQELDAALRGGGDDA